MKQTTPAKKATRVPRVTRIPDWLLRWQGKIDARKGETVVNTRIAGLDRRCATIENDEVAFTENLLFPIREEVARRLTMFHIDKKRYHTTTPHPEATVDDIRENRRIARQKKEAEANMNAAVACILSASETITHQNVLLEERLDKIRQACQYKVNAYVQGVRCRIRDYQRPAPEGIGDGMAIYEKKNRCLDEAVTETAELILRTKKEV